MRALLKEYDGIITAFRWIADLVIGTGVELDTAYDCFEISVRVLFKERDVLRAPAFASRDTLDEAMQICAMMFRKPELTCFERERSPVTCMTRRLMRALAVDRYCTDVDFFCGRNGTGE